MSAEVAHGLGQSNAVARIGLRAATLILLSAAAASAFGFDEETASSLVAQSGMTPAERNRPQLEVSASSLPRFENIDGSNRNARIDMTWLPPRRTALGLSLGMGTVDSAPLPAFGPRNGSPTSLDLGLHWRHTLDGNYRIDVTAWRRLMPPDALTLVQTREPSYGARVEMSFGRGIPKSGLVAERGFVGLQLESGARVTLRRSGGKPMIYYRTKF
ncbi:MAG: hypothetical protein K0Q43_4494 [Ramlibacter sp.]|jgi:hypothetical protein|nr:hypothetical protein [Ramlibacter sp.]